MGHSAFWVSQLWQGPVVEKIGNFYTQQCGAEPWIWKLPACCKATTLLYKTPWGFCLLVKWLKENILSLISREMHFVYLLALYYPHPQCTWFEKHGSSPVVVSISANNIIEHYVLGPGSPRNPVRWRKYVNKCDAVGSLLLWDTEGVCWGKRRNWSFLFGKLGEDLRAGVPKPQAGDRYWSVAY